MNIIIHSRDTILKLLNGDFPNNVAVISFYDPELCEIDKSYVPVDYLGKADRIFQIPLADIDFESLGEYNLSYETFFPESADLARFIYSAYKDGFDIICQCEYGQSRSAGCAAGILEHFYKNGISIFADYEYCPNQMVFHKVFDALEVIKNSP